MEHAKQQRTRTRSDVCAHCSWLRLAPARFLAGAAAFGATAVLPRRRRRRAAAPAKLIDTHHHFYPPAYQKAWADWEDARKIPHFGVQLAWTPRHRTSRRWTRTASPPRCCRWRRRPACGSTPAPKRRTTWRGCASDFAAEMVRDHPGRYGLFAPLSMLDIDATLERDRIRLRHAARPTASICKPTTATSGSATRPTSRCWRSSTGARRWSTCIRWSASCCGRLSVGAFPAVIEVPHDTTRTVVEPAAQRHASRAMRDIKWLFSHGGGTIPLLAGRIEAFYEQRARKPRSALRPTASKPNSAGSITTPPTPRIRPRWRR